MANIIQIQKNQFYGTLPNSWGYRIQPRINRMSTDSYYTESTVFNTPNQVVATTYVHQNNEAIKVKLEPNAKLPMYQTTQSVGADLACLNDVTLQCYVPTLVDTGVSIELPLNTAGLVYIRSSAALNGIVLSNGVGVIDPDYRGTIKLMLTNTSGTLKSFPKGTRLAQLIITPTVCASFVEVTELNTTPRNTGGFGSTGV